MTRHLHRIAAGLAVGIGVMAIAAGGQVMLGRTPGYYVIGWLPAYNFALGALTVFPTAVLIWNKSRWGLPAAVATLGAHAGVLVILLTAYRQVVAPASAGAMSFRLAVWLVILALMLSAKHRARAAA
jgi:hypothetical protein